MHMKMKLIKKNNYSKNKKKVKVNWVIDQWKANKVERSHQKV